MPIHFLKQLLGLTPKIVFFVTCPPTLAGILLAHMRSDFAQLSPCGTAAALSLTVVLESWRRAQMSALGNVFVMLQFFVSCFRTAWMFLFAYVLVIMSPRELSVYFYIYFGRSHEFSYHPRPLIKTLGSVASKTIWPN